MSSGASPRNPTLTSLVPCFALLNTKSTPPPLWKSWLRPWSLSKLSTAGYVTASEAIHRVWLTIILIQRKILILILFRGGSRMCGAPVTLVFASHLHHSNCAVRSRKTWGHKQPRGPKNLRAGPPESAGSLVLAQSAPPLNPPLILLLQ